MDQFPFVYDQYYDHAAHMSMSGARSLSFEDSHPLSIAALERKGLLQTSARAAVKIIGVWDTVGFHASGRGDEKIEFHNLSLSPLVQYAFHALALDETRWPFKPTLWVRPSKQALAKGTQTLAKFGRSPFTQDMQQVWFSGYHSDIGGGLEDPRLSDIALGWMIAQCSRTGLLDFTDLDSGGKETYLISDSSVATDSSKPKLQTAEDTWSTALGRANAPEGFKAFVRRFLSEDRRPLTIIRPDDQVVEEINDGSTNEMVHASIRDRDFGSWPCPGLSGTKSGDGLRWGLKDQRGLSLGVAPLVTRGGDGSAVRGVVGGNGVEETELVFKGRIKSIQADAELSEAADADKLGEGQN
jgi:Uncharacterized alpha/beta hydrolase domain (DUF2235)